MPVPSHCVGWSVPVRSLCLLFFTLCTLVKSTFPAPSFDSYERKVIRHLIEPTYSHSSKLEKLREISKRLDKNTRGFNEQLSSTWDTTEGINIQRRIALAIRLAAMLDDSDDLAQNGYQDEDIQLQKKDDSHLQDFVDAYTNFDKKLGTFLTDFVDQLKNSAYDGLRDANIVSKILIPDNIKKEGDTERLMKKFLAVKYIVEYMIEHMSSQLKNTAWLNSRDVKFVRYYLFLASLAMGTLTNGVEPDWDDFSDVLGGIGGINPGVDDSTTMSTKDRTRLNNFIETLKKV